MKKVLITSFALMMSFTGLALAANHEDMPDRAEFKAAMDDCISTYGKDDRDAVRSCMEEKGFQKPKHMHRPCDKEKESDEAES